MENLRQRFIAFSVDAGVLRFGEFITKAGRTSPYFFNAGLFDELVGMLRATEEWSFVEREVDVRMLRED